MKKFLVSYFILKLDIYHLINLIKFLENSLTFKFLLSFAAGSLIGDVFLHLIPEAFGKFFFPYF